MFHVQYIFFPKIVPFMRCLEKYGRARQATHYSITQHMCFAWCVTRATKTHSEYVILLFPQQVVTQKDLIVSLYVLYRTVTHTFHTFKTFWLEYLFSSSGTVCNWTFPCKTKKKKTVLSLSTLMDKIDTWELISPLEMWHMSDIWEWQ